MSGANGDQWGMGHLGERGYASCRYLVNAYRGSCWHSAGLALRGVAKVGPWPLTGGHLLLPCCQKLQCQMGFETLVHSARWLFRFPVGCAIALLVAGVLSGH